MWDPSARLFTGMPFLAAQDQAQGPIPPEPQTDPYEGDNGPPPCAYCGSPELAAMSDTGRTQRAKCSACGGVMYTNGGAWQPELIGDPANHPSGGADPASGGVGGAANAIIMGTPEVRTQDEADQHTASFDPAFSMWHLAGYDSYGEWDGRDDDDEVEEKSKEWDERHPNIDQMHRGMGVMLPDKLHHFVHDRSKPVADRAHALLDHVSRGGGSDERSGMGIHWSDDENVAHDFARRDADWQAGEDKKRRKESGDFSWGHEPDDHEIPHGKPATHVILHSAQPPRESINHNFDPNGDGSGAVYNYDEHGESEIPIHSGASVPIKGITFKQHKTFDDETPKDWDDEGEHHEFAEHQHRSASLPAEKCPTCHGTGKVEHWEDNPHAPEDMDDNHPDAYVKVTSQCDDCDGKGRFPAMSDQEEWQSAKDAGGSYLSSVRDKLSDKHNAEAEHPNNVRQSDCPEWCEYKTQEQKDADRRSVEEWHQRRGHEASFAAWMRTAAIPAGSCETCGGKGHYMDWELKPEAPEDGDEKDSYHQVKHVCGDCDGAGHFPAVSDEEEWHQAKSQAEKMPNSRGAQKYFHETWNKLSAEHNDKAEHPGGVKRPDCPEWCERKTPQEKARQDQYLRDNPPPTHTAALDDEYEVHSYTGPRSLKPVREALKGQGLTEDHPIHGVLGYGDKTHVAFHKPTGEVAGAIAHYTYKSPGSREQHINQMRTMNSHRGHGVGERLIQAVAKDTENYPKSHEYGMSVGNAIDSAMPFYAKLGANFRPHFHGGEWPPEKVQQLARGERPEPGTHWSAHANPATSQWEIHVHHPDDTHTVQTPTQSMGDYGNIVDAPEPGEREATLHKRAETFCPRCGDDMNDADPSVCYGCGHAMPHPERHPDLYAAAALNEQRTAAHGFDWDEIAHHYPDTYGEDNDGDGISYAANHLAHSRPDDPDVEGGESIYDMKFHHAQVDPQHIDHARHGGVNDARVLNAVQGYRDHPDQMPPLVLVKRHDVYQVADGHHRAEAARIAGVKPHAFVAESPYPHEPFGDGQFAPFHGANKIPERKPRSVPEGQMSLPFESALNDEVPWCAHLYHGNCTYPGDKLPNGFVLGIPQDRGPCPWKSSAFQQAACPISDPGPMAIMQISANQLHVAEGDYRMQHQAPDADYGAPLHDVTSMMPDFYIHPQYHDHGQENYWDSASKILKAKDQPEKKVRVYRALPAQYAHEGFHTGDWVSTSKDYARGEGRASDPKNDMPVISTTVPAKHLHTEGDVHEWGYNGPEINSGHSVAFKGGHHQEVRQHADGVIRPVQRKPVQEKPFKDWDIKHYPGNVGHDDEHHTVVAYDPDDNWAGRINKHKDGEDVEIEPQHQNTGLEEHMRSQFPPHLSALDRDFSFHFTATWADVRAKAKRLRAEGAVRIASVTVDGVVGEVKGEHHIYETGLNFVPGSRKVGAWECGCKWSAYAWGRSPAYKRFEGRMCSHALAMQFEAQARGMFGREITEDQDRPKWLKPHSPVVIEYQRPTDRAPGVDRTRRAVPPGNMRHTWSVRREAALDETQQRALDRLAPMPEKIEGEQLRDLYGEHGITLHANSPQVDMEDNFPPDKEMRHVAADEPLHTSQSFLVKSTLAKHISHPYDYSPDDYDPHSHDNRVWTLQHRGMTWIGEGHHRLVADRMTHRRGIMTGHRDLDEEYGPNLNSETHYGTYRYQQTVQGPEGYSDEEREIEGPLYHGGRGNLGPGDHLKPGRKTNSWGDEGSKSTHVYFTSDPDTALSYTHQIGPKGRLYEVEPTGDFKKDYGPHDYKTQHPLRVVRQVPQEEWSEWAHHTGALKFDPPATGMVGWSGDIHGHDDIHHPLNPLSWKDSQWAGGERRELQPDHELHTTQEGFMGVNEEDGRHYLDHPVDYSTVKNDLDLPLVARIDGRDWIGHGHHRLMADRMNDRPTTVLFKDMDAQHVASLDPEGVYPTDHGLDLGRAPADIVAEAVLEATNDPAEVMVSLTSLGMSHHAAKRTLRIALGEDVPHIGAAMKRCPECHASIAASATRCPECGAVLGDAPVLHEAANDDDPVYLRFGSWPKNERSQNGVTGFPEEGVSVYDLDHHGNPMDPDPHFSRGHEHDESCDPDCDMDAANSDYGNDTHEEMQGRVRRAERTRYNGNENHSDTGHLVKGEMAGIGHDGEPLLNKVRRVGDWIDHRHLFFPQAERHRLARDPYDEDYEAPKGLRARRRQAAEDARAHAHEFEQGVPQWNAGPLTNCSQCRGAGCGHCGGTGQVIDGENDTEMNAVPDQNDDAGQMMREDGLGFGDGLTLGTQGAKKSFGPSVAGVALKAADTGRVLMLQRGLDDPKDPAAGTWEFPGGHKEPEDKSSVHAGIREWEEEVGQPFPDDAMLHHSWTSPNGVYQGHIMIIPEERSLVMHNGRVMPNPDDPKGDMAEQAAWWHVDHARKNPALRPEVKSGTPWNKLKAAGQDLQKAADYAANDPFSAEESNPVDPPPHTNTTNPASTGFATSYDPEGWNGQEPFGGRDDAPMASYEADLHVVMDTPQRYSAPIPAVVLPEVRGMWNEGSIPVIMDRSGTLQSEPEGALPYTDGDQDPYADPNNPYTGDSGDGQGEIPGLEDEGSPSSVTASREDEYDPAVADIVAQFQATAAAGSLMNASGGGRSGGDGFNDIAGAAQAFLGQRTALKDFNFTEQQELINEHRGGVRARNTDSLQIQGTHYELIDQARGMDVASDDLFV